MPEQPQEELVVRHRKLVVTAALIGAVALTAIGLGVFIWFLRESSNQVSDTPTQEIASGCLREREKMAYEIVDKSGSARMSMANVIITDSQSSRQRKMSINVLQPGHYHPIEMHTCAVYFFGAKNFDAKRELQAPGYKEFVTRTSYDGDSRTVVILAEKLSDGTFVPYYSRDFRVSPTETHIVLIRSYHEQPDYALVIKNLNTGEDVFTLPLVDAMADNPGRNGTFDLQGWTRDGRYFWSGTSETAYVKSYIRIDTADWSYEVFDAPDGALGGTPLNIERGLVPINPGTQWTGSAEMDEILSEKMKSEGFVNRLYMYDLFTKQQELIVEIADHPLFWFEPEWLSDTELQYAMPDGVIKTYRVAD